MFPSFSDLQFLNQFGALTQSQINMYYNGGAINADQVKQLGFKVPAQANSANDSSKPSPVAHTDPNPNK